MNHDEVLQNRAEFRSDEVREADEQCCGNHLIFALRDRHHDFSLGIATVLQCLRFVEEQGAIPELPDEWWIAVRGRYCLDR
ncbi:hypothetical protein [Azotobacter vinelandii]|uniref:hypothetical protein n=1 Tax=Azotobacter vinelandii TaxID=354 RepID=UPI000772E98A|nr:hypothetical protein [Azotobacter vinelandii]